MQIAFKGKNLKIVFRLKFILGIMLICLITLSVVTYRSIKEHGKFNQRIYRNTIILYDIEKLVTEVVNLETSYRGFLLTRNNQYLEAYLESEKKIHQHFDQMSKDMSRSITLSNKLVSIERLLERLTNLLSLESIESINQGLAVPQLRLNIQEGNEVLNEIILQTDRMNEYQSKNIDRLMNLTRSLLLQNYILISIFIVLSTIILFLAYIFIYRELEKSQNLSNELEQSIHRLSQSNEELEQFAYVASHDLQEPLRKIIAFIDVIKRKHIDKIPAEGRAYFERIVQSTNRLQTLIIDLLNFSRGTKNIGDKKKLNLNTIIHEVVNDLSEVVREKNAVITYRIHKKRYVKGTAVQMRQLFQNIISNALKFTREGVKPVILISSSIVNSSVLENKLKILTAEKYIKIIISDNGIGFKEEYLNKIFTIFQRLHARSEYSGTGIGLALCKRIAENHNGYITANSTVGKGATFIIYLPLYEEKSVEGELSNIKIS